MVRIFHAVHMSEEFNSFHGMNQYTVKEIRIGEGITALDAGPLFYDVCFDDPEEKRELEAIDGIKLSLPDSLEKIGADTFDPQEGDSGYDDCVRYIRQIHISRNVRYIEGGAFWGLGRETDMDVQYRQKLEISVDSRNPYYMVKDGVLFTKDRKTLVYYPAEKKNKVYRIPKSVTHIEALAFARNPFWKEVVLPKGLKELGAGAFYNAEKLTKINLHQAGKLKRLQDFDGVRHKISMGSYGASMGCFLGDAEEDDGSPSNPAEYQEDFYEAGTAYPKDWYFLGTFEGTNLKSIQFPNGLKYASYDTFSNCSHLKEISLGKSFAGEINPDRLCDKKGFTMSGLPVTEMNIPKENTHYQVRNHILYSKDGKKVHQVLKSYRGFRLVFGREVRKIARGACARLARKKPIDVVVLGNLKQISYAAFSDCLINNFEVYGSVDKIGHIAFRYCCMKRFICHGSVKHIGMWAFFGNDLRKLSVGKDIQSIGERAFEDCGKVKKPRVKKKS